LKDEAKLREPVFLGWAGAAEEDARGSAVEDALAAKGWHRQR